MSAKPKISKAPKQAAQSYASTAQANKQESTDPAVLAKQVLRLAEKRQIPFEDGKDLSYLLKSIKGGEHITPETYRLVSEVLSFLYQVDRDWKPEEGFTTDTIPSGDDLDSDQDT